MLHEEFEVIEQSFQVTTSVAKVRATDSGRLWCCHLSVRPAERPEVRRCVR